MYTPLTFTGIYLHMLNVHSVQFGSVKRYRSMFVQRPCNDVYHSISVPFSFLLHSVFSFTCLARTVYSEVRM